MLDHPEFQSEDDPPNAGDDESADKGGKSPASVFPSLAPPQPPPSPPGASQSAKEPRKWRENLKLGMELIGLAALIVYTLFSILQWAQIRWTNRLTREALNGSDYTLQETLKKLQGQIDATNSLAGHAKDQATAAGIQAAASQAAARAAERQAAAQQRNSMFIEAQIMPNITLEQLDLEHPIRAGEITKVVDRFVNSGATPAYNTHCLWKPEFFTAGHEPDSFLPPSTGSNSTIGAREGFDCQMKVPLGNAIDVEKLTSHEFSLYISGEVIYEDMLHRTHHTPFCMKLYDPTGTALMGCKNQRKAD